MIFAQASQEKLSRLKGSILEWSDFIIIFFFVRGFFKDLNS